MLAYLRCYMPTNPQCTQILFCFIFLLVLKKLLCLYCQYCLLLKLIDWFIHGFLKTYTIFLNWYFFVIKTQTTYERLPMLFLRPILAIYSAYVQLIFCSSLTLLPFN